MAALLPSISRSRMWAIDIFSCYAVAGAGSVVGLGLVWLIRAEQPRVRYALGLYKWAYVCLAALLLVQLSPDGWRSTVTKVAIGFAGMGVTLLAWAFRQLNGRRTKPWVGVMATACIGLVLWLAALGSASTYVLAIGAVFSLISVGLFVDQGWLILRSAKVTGSELSLLVAALGFALIWLILLVYAATVSGPYPSHWLHMPSWLTPYCGLSLALLPVSVAAVVFSIVNERLHQQLRLGALTDDLTGALSRRGLRELGERMLAHPPKPSSGIAMLMIDIDQFKAINDRHGLQVGDEVLRHTSQVLRERLRDDALLARYGGEQFTILLNVNHQLEAQVVAERLRAAVEASPCLIKGMAINTTVSMGLSYHKLQGSLEEGLSRADALLQQAKDAGRNRVVSQSAEA